MGPEVINAEQLRGLILASLPKSVSFSFHLHKAQPRARHALGISPSIIFQFICWYKHVSLSEEREPSFFKDSKPKDLPCSLSL